MPTTAAEGRAAPGAVHVAAPAKVNLTLHVTGRRSDGYHTLDSLVVFTAAGDALDMARAQATSIEVAGPFAASVPPGPDNLVARAVAAAGLPLAVRLDKALPVGAGLGGGSADAAAVLRGAAALGARARADALRLGADVPVCLDGRPARMSGVGERLTPLPPLPDLPMVLVHPGVPVSTSAVFARRDGAFGAPMPAALPRWRDVHAAAAWLATQRNDLAPAAEALAPVIAEVRAALAAAPGCLLSRMSGSGSAVFGLFATPAAAARAVEQLAVARGDWWVCATRALAAPPPVQDRRLTT